MIRSGLKLLFGALAWCLVGPASALTISEAGPPKGLPPGGFEGLQFVDQKGCIYVRVGISPPYGWVPRVRRDGTVMCGLDPSFPSSAESDPTSEG